MPGELSGLRDLGVTGRLRITEAWKTGKGRHARMVIVGSHQVDRATELPQPDGAEVIYVQGGSGWEMIPPDAKTLDRAVRLEAANHTDRHTWFRVRHVNGASSGGTAFVWASGR
jgi:hypothetical protein